MLAARFGVEGPKRRDALRALGGAALSALSPSGFAQGKSEFRDLVVLIPGIMGSVLARDGKVIWGVKPDVLVELLKAGNLDFAFLRDQPDRSPVVATEVFPSTTLIPGFWKLDGYTESRAELIRGLGLRPNKNYFEFPYDWRKDNRLAARELATKLKVWLGEWREETKNSAAGAVLVCHSMGGLVAQYACEVLGLWSDVRAVFAFGTPFQGAPKAANRLVNGMLSSGLTTTLRSFDSVYQLLPTFACVDDGSGAFRKLSEVPAVVSVLDKKKIEGIGSAFHEECASASAANRTNLGQKSKILHTTSASTHKTVCGFVAQDGKLETRDFFRRPGDGGGDGTVPGFSFGAPLASSAGLRVPYYCNQLHGSVQTYEPALTNLVYYLLSEPNPDERRGTEPVSMTVSELVRLGELTHLEVVFKSTPPASLVRVESAESREVQWEAKLASEPATNRQRFSFQLPRSGLYRVSLGDRKDAIYCSDLTCVI